MLLFDIDTKSALPVYQQIVQKIKLEMLSARLCKGDPLPSIRDLAKYLKLNPNTVAKAYYILEDEGFIESRAGSGSRVCFQAQKEHDPLRRALLEEEMKTFLEKAVSLGFSRQEIEEQMKKVLP